ncbi:MAG: hypothetical protein M9936_28620 [Caldilinea sp.]|nr:hypothetical protein [Caldilinea sp.]
MNDTATRIAGWLGGLALIAALIAGVWFDGWYREALRGRPARGADAGHRRASG